MRRITRDNYEEFFLDYLDGNLNAAEEILLEEFLSENPDLKEELEEMDIVQLDPEPVAFNFKDDLRKTRFDEDFDEYCVAHMEGDLSREEGKAFEAYLHGHEEREKQALLYRKTRLEPDVTIGYPNKSELKRNGRVIPMRYIFRGVAVAASLTLLITLWSKDEDVSNSRVAQTIPLKQEIEKTVENPVHSGAVSKTEPVKIVTVGEVQEVVNQNQENVNQLEQVPNAGEKGYQKVKVVDLPVYIRIAVIQPLKKEIAPLSNHSAYGNEMIAMNYKDRVVEESSAKSSYGGESGLEEAGMVWKESELAYEEPRRKFNLLRLAGKGIEGLGRLAGKKVQMEKVYDPESDRTRIAFNTSGLGFSTTLKRSEKDLQ